MTWAIIGLMAGFILVLALLYFLLLKTDLSAVYKFLALALVTMFYWVQYYALLQYSGWPTRDALPEEFVLIAAEVHEPNKQTGERGKMYWWIRAGQDQSLPPRVYELPYEAKLHDKTEQVVKEQKSGGMYLGKRSEAGSNTSSNGLGIRFEKIRNAERHKKN